MIRHLFFLIPIVFLISCSQKNPSINGDIKNSSIEKSNFRKDSIPKIELESGFKIVGYDIETYKEYGVFTSLLVKRNDKTIYHYDNIDEFKLEGINAYLIPSKNNINQFDIVFESYSPPSKPRNIKLRIINDTIYLKTIIPSFEAQAKNLDNDGYLEFAGYWSDFEVCGENEIVTSYNPILFFEINENGLQLDTLLTIDKNTFIYGDFFGFDFSEKKPQPATTMKRHSEIIDEIKKRQIKPVPNIASGKNAGFSGFLTFLIIFNFYNG